MSNSYIEQHRQDGGKIGEEGGYNLLEGYNPELDEVRQHRDYLNDILGAKATEPNQSLFFSLRGTLNIVLGDNRQALDDYLEAKRACYGAPVEPMLSMLYRDLGLRKQAIHAAHEIPCERTHEEQCWDKILSLILLDEFDDAESLSSRDYVSHGCVYKMIVDLFRQGQITRSCDDGGFDDEFRWQYALELLRTGKSEAEYRKFYEEMNIYDMEGFSSFYIALYKFSIGIYGEACSEIDDVMAISATAKRLLYEYELGRKIKKDVCSG